MRVCVRTCVRVCLPPKVGANKKFSDEPILPPIRGLIRPGSASVRAICVPMGLQSQPIVVGTAKCDIMKIQGDKLVSVVRGC